VGDGVYHLPRIFFGVMRDTEFSTQRIFYNSQGLQKIHFKNKFLEDLESQLGVKTRS
jgi:hypothetical protein